MCEEWKNNPEEFIKWSLNNGFDENLDCNKCSLDRIDVNGNYCPENCRWTDKITQANNTRTNHYLKYNGEIKTMAEWSRELGIKYSVFRHLINKWNWSIEDLIKNEFSI